MSALTQCSGLAEATFPPFHFASVIDRRAASAASSAASAEAGNSRRQRTLRNRGVAEQRPPAQVRGPHAVRRETVRPSQRINHPSSIRSRSSRLEGAGEGGQQRRRRAQVSLSSLSQEQVVSDASTRSTSQENQWPECVYDMMGPEIFDRVKNKPVLAEVFDSSTLVSSYVRLLRCVFFTCSRGLMLVASKESNMTMFHHMLRRRSRDDEQMLAVFKCIYEDEALREQVPPPCLTELKCSSGQTLAFYAAAYGHVKCLEWILQQAGGLEEQKRYLEIRDNLGDTPLHHAARGGHQRIIELLLEKDPNMINKARVDGRTPIFDAFESPHVVRLLLRHGADCEVRCREGRTPLEEAKKEYKWKSMCAGSSKAVVPKRVQTSVKLLKNEMQKRQSLQSSQGNNEPQQQQQNLPEQH